MQSKIYLEEIVNNEERAFGSALEYYPVRIEDEDGNISNALLTQSQINKAILRANRNPEDVPETTIWESIFG
jgi:hypothetical protein